MTPIDKIKLSVADLYGNHYAERDFWADWLYQNHVLVVAKFAREVAERHDANPDTCEAVALLHDLGDALTPRSDPMHEKLSLDKARELLVAAGYEDGTVNRLVEDALRYHSCHGDERPQSDEGKVLATADALAHLSTDFYIFMRDNVFASRPPEVFQSWVDEKINRDFFVKIMYPDERDGLTERFETLKQQVSSRQ